jgi:hypothetical protein
MIERAKQNSNSKGIKILNDYSDIGFYAPQRFQDQAKRTIAGRSLDAISLDMQIVLNADDVSGTLANTTNRQVGGWLDFDIGHSLQHGRYWSL